MATMIIGGEKLTMSTWMKARLLDVQPTADPNVLSVESGSERGKRYDVRHDGKLAVSCDCPAYTPNCAHRQAAERYLVSVEVLGAEIAQDLQAPIDDSDLAAIADEIVAAEKAQTWHTFIAADGSELYTEHASDCDCEPCETARWQKIEHEMIVEREHTPFVQVDAFEQVYAALPFGTVVSIADLCRKLSMMDHMVCNAMSVLQQGKRIVYREVADGVYYVDTPAAAYRNAFYGDFAA